MKIVKKRIRSVQPYIFEFQETEKMYVALEIEPKHYTILEKYGFDPKEVVQEKVPRPLKSVSILNAEGSWKVHRDQPKEPRVFERSYHCVDWHGTDHYGTYFQTRDCYPRTRILPQLIKFTLHNGFIRSPLYSCNPNQFNEILLTINLFLEIFGECDIMTEQLVAKMPIPTAYRLPWTILPVGNWDKEKINNIIMDIIETVPQNQKHVISNRHTLIWSYKPTNVYTGDEGFWGYIVYEFLPKNLYVFESNRPDNATYIFRGNWKQASKLSKAEILSGHLQEARLIHTDMWNSHLLGMLERG